MKTTLDIEDQLLVKAKMVAAQRRTTLRALVEHALRREIEPAEPRQEGDSASAAFIETSEKGLPRLKRRTRRKVSSQTVYRLLEDEDL